MILSSRFPETIPANNVSGEGERIKNIFGKILGPVLIAALLVSPMLGAVRVSADTLSWSAETLPLSATVLEDVYVSPDGTKVYLLSNDGAVTSLWRYDGSWASVFTTNDINGYIVRGAPDNNDVLYIADSGTTTLYYTNNAGVKWYHRVTGNNIQDLAVESTNVAYVLTTDCRISRTTNGGSTWGPAMGKFVYPSDAAEPQLVTVAPDDASVVAIVADDNEVYVSMNGGMTWSGLGTPREGNEAPATTLYDIGISEATAGVRYIAVAGTEAGSLANVWYFNYGAVVPYWKDTNDLAGFGSNASDRAMAVAFSPNFVSDLAMVSITEEDDAGTGLDYVRFEIFDFNAVGWNTSAGFAGYPVTLVNDDGITGVDSASISLAPDTNVAFVGLTVAGDTDAIATSGIYRLQDTTQTDMKTGVKIHSVAYNGSNLVAGEYASNEVWYSTDPLAPVPAVSPAVSRPIGENGVVVSWAGSNVLAGTSGYGSAFSVSTDNGMNFTDIGLANAGTDVSDFIVAYDNTTIYATDRESDNIGKSTDSGYTWMVIENSLIADGQMLVSLGTDKLIKGSTDGFVAYSTDGNGSWTEIDAQIESGALLTQVTATGLANGDYIFAASSKANTKVLRWQIGISTSWTDLVATSTLTDFSIYGMGLNDGVLYVLGSNGIDSEGLQCLNPTTVTPTWSTFTATGKVMNDTPQALQLSAGSVKLWAISTNDNTLQSYTTVSVLLDSDVDGIYDEVDLQPIVYSNDFSDIVIGGTTTGTIVNRGDQNLTVREEPNPDGVRIVADSSGGPTSATISACGGTAIFYLSAGDEVIVTYSSVTITVLNGKIDITFVAADGTKVTTSLSMGNSITFDPTTITFTAPATNSAPVIIQISGVPLSIHAGETFTINHMSLFEINNARIDFKKKPDDDKVSVQGTLKLDLVRGNGVNISDDVIVSIGPLIETIKMEAKGKKDEKWEYERPKNGNGNIKHMTINWKSGEFDIRMDRAEIAGVTNPVNINILIGNDLGHTSIQMREKEHFWDYKAH